MIKFMRGNLLESTADFLVNPINCVGVMGAGLARQFARKYPAMLEYYKTSLIKWNDGTTWVLGTSRFEPGCLMYYSIPGSLQTIVLFPTKDDWKQPSKLEYIELGLKQILDDSKCWGWGLNPARRVAFPALGCGLGGLRWTDVRQLMIQYSKDMPFSVEVYEP